MASPNSPFQRRYPPEMRERAVRMVREAIAERGESLGVVSRVAGQLGIGPESLRKWVKQADIDNGKWPGVTTEQQRRIAELERRGRVNPSPRVSNGPRTTQLRGFPPIATYGESDLQSILSRLHGDHSKRSRAARR